MDSGLGKNIQSEKHEDQFFKDYTVYACRELWRHAERPLWQ